MNSRFRMIATIVLAGSALVACSSPRAATSAPSAAAPSAAPSVAASQAPSDAPSAAPSAAGAVTIEAQEVGAAGNILVAGENGMTLYVFSEDTKDSGTSACTDGCITAWPALTVDAGETPTGGPGVTGTIGTITRPDDGSLQVTYNGLPLHFFQNDTAPGDLNGVYDKWETVAP